MSGISVLYMNCLTQSQENSKVFVHLLSNHFDKEGIPILFTDGETDVWEVRWLAQVHIANNGCATFKTHIHTYWPSVLATCRKDSLFENPREMFPIRSSHCDLRLLWQVFCFLQRLAKKHNGSFNATTFALKGPPRDYLVGTMGSLSLYLFNCKEREYLSRGETMRIQWDNLWKSTSHVLNTQYAFKRCFLLLLKLP